jgi:hypothetical protein
MTDSFDTTLMDMLWVLWAAALVFVSPYHAGFHWRRRYYLRRQRQYHVRATPPKRLVATAFTAINLTTTCC